MRGLFIVKWKGWEETVIAPVQVLSWTDCGK
jgi:hypothetical protein